MLRRALCPLMLLLIAALSTQAAGPEAAKLLPETTAIYAEVAKPGKLIDGLIQHPIKDAWGKSPAFKRLTEDNPDFLKAKAGLAFGEFVIGKKWHEAIRIIAGEQLVFGVDAATEGAILLAESPSEDDLHAMRDKLLKLARDDAKKNGKPDPFEEHEYREHKVYKAGDAVFAIFGNWLVITNKAELGRQVADRIIDEKFDGKTSLAEQEQFTKAKEATVGKPAIWAYADVETIREAGLAEQLYQEKSDNPGIELLAGGILAALRDTPYATASLYVDDDGLRVAYQAPMNRSEVAEGRQHYFGDKGEGRAPVGLHPEGELLSLTTYRDFGDMWRRRADLFDEDANAELAQADANLTTVFAGADFGTDVLGSLKPQMQFLAARQSFDGQPRPPKIKLPAMAMVFRLNEPEKMRRQLKVSFQSLIGLTNLGAGQEELPQLELTTERRGDGQMVVASYEGLDKETEVGNDIIYNFSPSLAFVGDHFIISSTRELAGELFDLADSERGGADASNERIENTKLTVQADVLNEVLKENRGQLVAQNMLENGHGKVEAEREIDSLLAVVELMKQASLKLTTSENDLRVEVGLKVK